MTTPLLDGPEGRGPALRRLHLLGPMRVESSGRWTAVPRGDAQRLLGYLALHHGPAVRREALSESLWPDAAERSRRSLSDTLYRVRRQLGDGWLEVDLETVALRRGIDVDVREFDRLCASSAVADAEAAVAAYGELLPGLYDDWALEHRAARHAAYVAALGRLATAREEAGDLEQAVLDARQLVGAEPFDELAHQRYLRLLGRLHRYGQAVAHYQELRALLADELGVEPLATTVEIVEQLIAERDLIATAPTAERTRFVGRVAERSTGLRTVEALFEGRGAVVCVEGPAGIGKSRLLDELIRGARWRGATVWQSGVGEVPDQSPLAPLARTVGPMLAAPLRLEVESRLDQLTLRTLGPLHRAWDSGVDREGGADESVRLRNGLRVVGDVLARAGRVVLVLDDLHWASASTWDHLAALADGFVPGGGVLAVAYRRPEVESTAGWSVLQDWDRRGLATVLRLGPLEVGEVAELIGRAGSAEPAEVLALTGGVPFYIEQWKQDSEWGTDSATMTRRRLDVLDETQRAALECAAVLGESTTFAVWREVLGIPALELAAIADRLVADRWLLATSDGHAFTHDLLRLAVYDEIAGADRRRLHERAAAAVSELEPRNWRLRAFHLDRAGQPLEAALAYREAGRVLRAELAFSDVLDAWRRSLELLPRRRRRERLDLDLAFAEVCDVAGGGSIRREVLIEAIELARRLDDDEALLRGLVLAGGLAWAIGEGDDGERWLDEAEQLATQRGDQRRLADVFYRRGALRVQAGRWPEGLGQFETALDLLDRHEDRELYGRVLKGLAVTALRMGKPTETVAWLEEALAEYAAAGDPMNELRINASLLVAYHELGAWDRLADTARRCEAMARRFGDITTIGVCCQALALVASAVGDRVEARAQIAEAERCWTVSGQRRMVAGAINTAGLIAQDDGEYEEAIARYRAAIDAAREVDGATEVAYASHDLGSLFVDLGMPADAIPLLRTAAQNWTDAGNALLRAKSEACLGLALLDTGEPGDDAADLAESGFRLFRSGDYLAEHPQAWLWSLSRLLSRLDRRADAEEVCDAAHRELLRQAATIADPERRLGFFERVPLNRAIVADAAARSGTERVAVVRLARVDAPLGRALLADELVEVEWTVHAADDDAIADIGDRRRHRLRRLLDEAATRSAAPTDDDLAAALGVSRRTVLRDMAAIDRAARSATRRRARSGVP